MVLPHRMQRNARIIPLIGPGKTCLSDREIESTETETETETGTEIVIENVKEEKNEILVALIDRGTEKGTGTPPEMGIGTKRGSELREEKESEIV